MIDRYTRPEMAAIWAPENRFQIWLEIELLAIAHNGNLVNARTLRDEYEAWGSIFQTSTDSEVIVHLLAKPTHVAKPNNIAHCLNHVKGAYCFIVITSYSIHYTKLYDMESAASKVFDEAENRMHINRALFAVLKTTSNYVQTSSITIFKRNNFV